MAPIVQTSDGTYSHNLARGDYFLVIGVDIPVILPTLPVFRTVLAT